MAGSEPSPESSAVRTTPPGSRAVTVTVALPGDTASTVMRGPWEDALATDKFELDTEYVSMSPFMSSKQADTVAVSPTLTDTCGSDPHADGATGSSPHAIRRSRRRMWRPILGSDACSY